MLGRKTPSMFNSWSSRWSSVSSISDNRTPDTRLCPSFLRQNSKALLCTTPLSHLGWKSLEFAMGGCSKIHGFETITSSKLPKEFLATLLLIPGGDLLQSEWLNLVQSRQITQKRLFRLRKSCLFTVNCNCIKWESVSTKGDLHDYAIKGMIFAFLAQHRVWLIAIDGKTSKMELAFLFVGATRFFAKQVERTKQNSRFVGFGLQKKR